MQVCLRLFRLSLNVYKVMKIFKVWPEYFKKTFISSLMSRLKLKSLNQTCISSKRILQLSKTILLGSFIFLEKKGWRISDGEKNIIYTYKALPHRPLPLAHQSAPECPRPLPPLDFPSRCACAAALVRQPRRSVLVCAEHAGLANRSTAVTFACLRHLLRDCACHRPRPPTLCVNRASLGARPRRPP